MDKTERSPLQKSGLQAALRDFGLPRLIIAGFLLALFIMAPLVGADLVTQITNTINRFSWNAVLVLAMVPMVHSGCGLNFGLPLEAAVYAASTAPAQAVGLDVGVLEVGRPADLVVLDKALDLKAVFVDGNQI